MSPVDILINSPRAGSQGDPSTLAAAVGSAAQQLMRLALQIIEGGHSLEALEVVTQCFEG
jgi:hypothetical protein